MAPARRKQTSSGRGRKTLVRGADGALYLLSQSDLAPFKVHEKKAKKLNEILTAAQKNPAVTKLSSKVVKDIQAVEGCIAVGGPPDIHINT
jgi:hypothetical protein